MYPLFNQPCPYIKCLGDIHTRSYEELQPLSSLEGTVKWFISHGVARTPGESFEVTPKTPNSKFQLFQHTPQTQPLPQNTSLFGIPFSFPFEEFRNSTSVATQPIAPGDRFPGRPEPNGPSQARSEGSGRLEAQTANEGPLSFWAFI